MRTIRSCINSGASDDGGPFTSPRGDETALGHGLMDISVQPSSSSTPKRDGMSRDWPCDPGVFGWAGGEIMACSFAGLDVLPSPVRCARVSSQAWRNAWESRLGQDFLQTMRSGAQRTPQPATAGGNADKNRGWCREHELEYLVYRAITSSPTRHDPSYLQTSAPRAGSAWHSGVLDCYSSLPHGHDLSFVLPEATLRFVVAAREAMFPGEFS